MGRETITPVLLSGGAGTRLWPLSRALYAKQFHRLVSDKSLVQETALRTAGQADFAAPVVVCGEEQRFLMAEQLRQVQIGPRAIVLEPLARNTAPAAAAACHVAGADDPEALLLLMPADHVIGDVEAFLAAVRRARPAALGGAIVTFGIRPTRAETGYGYILPGPQIEGVEAHRIERFVEKPDAATAERLLAEGRHFWNSGVFLFRADVFLAEYRRVSPESERACADAAANGSVDLDFFRLERSAFAGAASQSIDYAVMEKTERGAVLPIDLDWSDIGSWRALADIAIRDDAENAFIGDVVAEDVSDSYLRAESGLVAALGVDHLVVVATRDAVLVADKSRVQDVRRLVDRLAAAKRPEASEHHVVYRPWGCYQTVDVGERFQVKRITVNPGARLSLQKHGKRAEHWVVVRGTARVTRDGEVFDLAENESAFIPLGAVHRLENPAEEPLHLIEVQSGAYLGEDDIVRLEDNYGRQDAHGQR